VKKFSITKNRLAMPLLAALSLGVIQGAANAADFPQRVAIGATSAKYGMNAAAVPLLRREPGPGMGIMSSQLLKEFSSSTDPITTAGDYKTTRGVDKIGFIGNGWSMQVFADGTRIKYRNYDYLDGTNNKPLPVTSRLTQSQLEKLGREFIATKLKSYVRLGSNETLVPYFTEFQVGGGGSTLPGSKPVAEEVFASTVIFARSVGNIPVLGAGSKIAVIFANDGRAAGFDMDWAAYQDTGIMQKTAPLTEVQGRAMKLFPFDLQASDTKTTRFECGYFDIGARKRDTEATLQSACLVHANKRQIVDKVVYARDPTSGHTVAAHMAPIPAGATIERDASWPQALTLLGITLPNTDVPGEKRAL